MKYNVVDLFCGCGGFTIGFDNAGLNVIAGIYIWDKAIDTYKNNNNHIALQKDLQQFPPNELKKIINDTKVDILVDGPPCQGFSMAGKRDTKDPRNSLFMEYVKYLKYYKPMAFIMENVPGILSMKTEKGEKVIDIIMTQLKENYNCEYYKLLAADFEVPQNRKRVIFIGFRKDLNILPTQPQAILSKDSHIAVKTILENKNNVDRKYFLSQKAIDGIKKKKEKMIIKKHGFGAQYLDLDKPSYTIPARYWRDGYDALVKYSDNDVRRLTEKELQKIQTFPNNFQFSGTRKDIIMQIGNAVPCKLAYHLGKYLINKLNTLLIDTNKLQNLDEKYLELTKNILNQSYVKQIEETNKKYIEVLRKK